MFKFIKKEVSKMISSILESGEKDNAINPMPSKNELHKAAIDEKKLPNKLWKKEYPPLRQVVLWGWDDNNQPGFLILYGRHKFNKTHAGNMLEDGVTYTSYAIFKGLEGHLPSFEAVKIIEQHHYNKKSDAPQMYYKKGLRYSWGWSGDSKYIVNDFENLPTEHHLLYPYFIPMTQEKYLEKIQYLNIQFAGFKLAKSPNEILKLDSQYAEYSRILTNLMSNPSLYTRRKCLSELVSKNPQKEVYDILLQMGSSELISGLFLELAKASNPILLQEAKTLIESEIKWAQESYAKGVRRCATVYLNALEPSLKEERINWIRKNLWTMDLHLIGINGKDFPTDKIIDGAAYRKYAISELLKDIYRRYDYQSRKYIEREAPRRYKVGPYTDGVKLKLIDFKNTIQESEIYGLAEVMGKVAYYLDAPRLTYYFKGNGRTKALKYFHRYVRRAIDAYAVNNPDKFMEAMINLLTGYTQHDFVCKYNGNFQYNELLKHYLYYDFMGKAPDGGWRNWKARYEWATNDQLMKLQGRHEFKKEIWDDHLDVVADIAIGAKIDTVIKACYYILKDSPKSSAFIDNIKYSQLINLTLVAYKPLSEMFSKIFNSKISQVNTFDPELMLGLIGCPDEKMHQYAMEFFKRTNGSFSPGIIADLLLLNNIDQWEELFQRNLISLQGDQYADFVRRIIDENGKFFELDRGLPENIKDIISVSANEIQHVSKSQKIEIMTKLFGVLLHKPKIPEWIRTFMEELIFSFSYEELETLLSEISIEPLVGVTSSRNKRIISVLESIRNRKLPTDSQIVDILGVGTSKMIKMLFSIINQNTEELANRFSTLLIMLESEVTVLNIKAQEVFDSIPQEKQKKLHAIIIDSPVQKAYLFGLEKLDKIYKDLIPEEFIFQMLEHGSAEVKAYISDKIDKVFDNLGDGNKNIFMYYLKTLLLLPNKVSSSKDRVCEAIPRFALLYKDKSDEIQNILLDIGGSNTIKDSERALVTLAKIRGEVMLLES